VQKNKKRGVKVVLFFISDALRNTLKHYDEAIQQLVVRREGVIQGSPVPGCCAKGHRVEGGGRFDQFFANSCSNPGEAWFTGCQQAIYPNLSSLPTGYKLLIRLNLQALQLV
jgi:hypothetical protein